MNIPKLDECNKVTTVTYDEGSTYIGKDAYVLTVRMGNNGKYYWFTKPIGGSSYVTDPALNKMILSKLNYENNKEMYHDVKQKLNIVETDFFGDKVIRFDILGLK